MHKTEPSQVSQTIDQAKNILSKDMVKHQNKLLKAVLKENHQLQQRVVTLEGDAKEAHKLRLKLNEKERLILTLQNSLTSMKH